METSKLKKFAQFARRSLLEQVTAKLKLVLAEESPARRERPQAIKKLEEAVTDQGKEQIIERVAYIWFNRFCALRFMDVNRYNRIGIVSPAEAQFQPEILADAKMGHIDEEMVSESTRQKIFALLDSKTPSQDPQGEAYRLLVVAACNYWYGAMPFLFERIDDYTELLMPDDLLSGNSILAYTREAMTPDACEDVEVIGWLYQFYISEKKDQVFADLKKNKKVTPENIPAATQLFTPHWIVRYLVENSLGRLWMLNRPNSGLIEQMDYYIKPAPAADGKEQPETDFLRINSPEEIKICDPACGSGHMLTYAFDLLYAIYEEEGYEPADIPAHILTHNLYGIEIDERAGELAAFALTMKAAAGNPKEEKSNHRRFFRNPIQPNICVLQNVHFDESELKEYMDFVGRDLFTAPLQSALLQFEEADNFGSLIRPVVTDVDGALRALEAKDVSEQLFLSETHKKALKALRQADYLSPKYHVVIANPPYMGRRNMNSRISAWAKSNYPNSHADLFSMFMERCLRMLLQDGLMGMINLPSWLFLTAFSGLRNLLVKQFHIQSMLHMGRGIFGVDWGSTAFVVKNGQSSEKKGVFFKLHRKVFQYLYPGDIERLFLLSNTNPEYKYDFNQYRDNSGLNEISAQSYEKGQRLRYTRYQKEFKKVPGSPIAYWLPESIYEAFEAAENFGEKANPKVGMQTAKNDFFLRFWWELSHSLTSLKDSSLKKWVAYSKGGDFRKWWGNHEHLLRYELDGRLLRKQNNATLPDEQIYEVERCTWSDISAGKPFAARRAPKNSFYDISSHSFFPKHSGDGLLAYSNSNFFNYIVSMLNPGLHFQVGDIRKVPSPSFSVIYNVSAIENKCVSISRLDWDNYETSWDFTRTPLLNPEIRHLTIKSSCQRLRDNGQEMTLEMKRLEEENNRIFIDAYDLQDELTPEVPLEEVTLTCNPHYRYGNNKSEEELEALLLADTMRDLVSYAVGCMFGRYALEKPGLILANQGETISDYLNQIPEPGFSADEDNVIPMLDGDWFTDDITERFREFLRKAFGEEHYEENLHFLEDSLYPTNATARKRKTIRDYFLKDFYKDHWSRYKKRPIYWLFSSPEGSFNALIYMHRYQPHTVGTVLEYLRDFKDEKLQARKNHLEAVSISAGASQGEKTKALKEIEKINKILAELDDYERDVLYPLATEQVEIDLDDGVKANYPKFGDALKKITGLSQ